jgi:hypothetical protein
MKWGVLERFPASRTVFIQSYHLDTGTKSEVLVFIETRSDHNFLDKRVLDLLFTNLKPTAKSFPAFEKATFISHLEII